MALYQWQKNKAKNYFHRRNIFSEKIAGDIKNTSPQTEEIEINLSDENITDSQFTNALWLFVIHSIPLEAQIGLGIYRILCGFWY
jgi:RNA polymerase sigma-70 factor (ECF subfamily)